MATIKKKICSQKCQVGVGMKQVRYHLPPKTSTKSNDTQPESAFFI